MKQETFDGEYADAYCALLFQCEDANALAALGWVEESDCVSELAATDTATADTYDKKAAKECLDALPSVTCNDLANNAFPSACAKVE